MVGINIRKTLDLGAFFHVMQPARLLGGRYQFAILDGKVQYGDKDCLPIYFQGFLMELQN